MRHNPYLKNRSIFLPLLMRGSASNSVLSPESALEENNIIGKLAPTVGEEYTVDSIRITLVAPPELSNTLISCPFKTLMSITPCTQELFEAVMGFNPSIARSKPKAKQKPVEYVTWYDSILFCNRLSELQGLEPYYLISDIEYHKSARIDSRSILQANVSIAGGNGFRLPTGDEWEFFAKAGTNNRFSGTDSIEELANYATFQPSTPPRPTEPSAVGTLASNDWWMFDMSGNVWEWCWDLYPEQDEVAIPAQYYRRRAGGSWLSSDWALDIANRKFVNGQFPEQDQGFRICKNAP